VTYPDLTSRSAALFERARKTMPGGNTRHMITFAPYMVYAKRGEGCRLWDVDGNEFIDWVNNFSSQIHGHNPPQIVDALIGQLQDLMSCILPATAELELAELLVDRIPGIEKIRFNNSGTEAVMVAVKAARAFTDRGKILKTEGGYHGQYDLVETSFLPQPDTWGPEEKPSVLPFAPGTPQSLLDEVVVAPYNNVEVTRQLIRDYAAELAAVIVDPVPARLGFTRAEPEFLAMLREETRRHGIVLIFDEVFCARAGYHGAQGECGVTPDLTTMGKIIGGGLPVGAVGGSNDVMSVFDNLAGPLKVSHSGTFTANSLTMVAGLTAMRMLTQDVFARLAEQGDRLRNGLTEVMTATGFKGRVSGEASMTAIQFAERPLRNYRDLVRGSGPDYLQRMQRLHRHMMNQGVLMATRGMLIGSTVMNDSDIDETIEKAGRAFQSFLLEEERSNE
jgi:glutamate-1-semialdehyde 2,1-aminomutase